CCHFSSGPLEAICIGFSPWLGMLSGKYLSSRVRLLRPECEFQSSINLSCRDLTASPLIFRCVSRQKPNFLLRPRYSSPTLKPPTYPTSPSMTTIFRWFLEFIRGLIRGSMFGKNDSTCPPSFLNYLKLRRLRPLEPISS